MLGKTDLLETIATSNRGLAASPMEKQAILAKIRHLEELNPTPNPTTAPSLLDGDWRLLYTTSQELLGIDRFPGLTLGEVYQCIRVAKNQVFNIAQLTGLPLLDGLVTVAAEFEITSPQRLTVQFKRGVLGLQRLLDYQTPSQFIQAFQTKLTTKTRFLALDFDIQPRERAGWIDLTYLDTNLRINRGNEGSVFVLVKD